MALQSLRAGFGWISESSGEGEGVDQYTSLAPQTALNACPVSLLGCARLVPQSVTPRVEIPIGPFIDAPKASLPHSVPVTIKMGFARSELRNRSLTLCSPDLSRHQMICFCARCCLPAAKIYTGECKGLPFRIHINHCRPITLHLSERSHEDCSEQCDLLDNGSQKSQSCKKLIQSFPAQRDCARIPVETCCCIHTHRLCVVCSHAFQCPGAGITRMTMLIACENTCFT